MTVLDFSSISGGCWYVLVIKDSCSVCHGTFGGIIKKTYMCLSLLKCLNI